MPQPAPFLWNKNSPQICYAQILIRILGFALLSHILFACSQNEWSNREPSIIEGIRIDSLKFQPTVQGFVFVDSTTSVLFKKYYTGYLPRAGHACAEILDFGIEPALNRKPLAHRPHTKIRLPNQEDCPLDREGRDTTLKYKFTLQSDSMVRLLNSAGTLTDSAKLLKGWISKDSLKGAVSKETRTFVQGRWIYLDSTSLTKPRLRTDSLSSCEYPPIATYSRLADSIKIVITLVHRDTSTAQDSCRGKLSTVEIFPALIKW